MNSKIDKKSIIHRIKEARIYQKLTQEDLAKKAGLSSNQIISQIENESRSIKADELFKIANALHVDMSSLIKSNSELVRPVVFWRNAPPSNAEAIEADLVEKCRRYSNLENLCGYSSNKFFPKFDVKLLDLNYKNIHELADEVSKTMDLGCRPASSLAHVLEDKYSVRIFYNDLSEGSAAATSCDYGNAILINGKEPPWRRNFDFAHELFHLVTWSATIQLMENCDRELINKVEKFANKFAACLLMPETYLNDELDRQIGDKQKVSYLDLINLARTFEVSLDALLWQLLNIDRLKLDSFERLRKDKIFKDLDRESLKGKWSAPAKQLPFRYVELAYTAYKKGKLSKMKLAEYLGCGLLDIDSILEEYGIVETDNDETEITFIGRQCNN